MNKAMTQKELREWGDKAWSEAVKQSQYTPWFPGVEVPERVGVFERRRWDTDTVFYSYWDGRQWWPAGVTPNDAIGQYLTYKNVGVPRWVSQLWYWRGRTRHQ